jgi:hypothetical protein
MSQPAPGGGATRASTPPPDPANASPAQLLGGAGLVVVGDRVSR